MNKLSHKCHISRARSAGFSRSLTLLFAGTLLFALFLGARAVQDEKRLESVLDRVGMADSAPRIHKILQPLLADRSEPTATSPKAGLSDTAATQTPHSRSSSATGIQPEALLADPAPVDRTTETEASNIQTRPLQSSATRAQAGRIQSSGPPISVAINTAPGTASNTGTETASAGTLASNAIAAGSSNEPATQAASTGTDSVASSAGSTSVAERSDPAPVSDYKLPEFDPSKEPWATPNCPNALMPGSSQADADNFKNSYGCRYQYTCWANNASDGMTCYYLFSA